VEKAVINPNPSRFGRTGLVNFSPLIKSLVASFRPNQDHHARAVWTNAIAFRWRDVARSGISTP